MNYEYWRIGGVSEGVSIYIYIDAVDVHLDIVDDGYDGEVFEDTDVDTL